MTVIIFLSANHKAQIYMGFPFSITECDEQAQQYGYIDIPISLIRDLKIVHAPGDCLLISCFCRNNYILRRGKGFHYTAKLLI